MHVNMETPMSYTVC